MPHSDECMTPREPEEVPRMGLAVVLANDTSRYEGDWHQLQRPEEELLRHAFACANTGVPKVICACAHFLYSDLIVMY